MRVLRPFDWVTRFTRPTTQPPEGYELITVVQPVLDVSCDWPLKLSTFRKTGTLAVGTNNFDFYPGPELEGPAAYPEEQLRHHCIWQWIEIQPGASLAITAVIMGPSGAFDNIYTGSAGTVHWPLRLNRTRPYISFPFFFRISIAGAAGTESYDLAMARWDRPQSEPLLIAPG